MLPGMDSNECMAISTHLFRVTIHEKSWWPFHVLRVNTYFCPCGIRYSDGEDAVYRLQHKLIDEILIGLFWHEYLFSASSKDQDIAFSSYTLGQSNKESREGVDNKYWADHEENLGKCIIKIVSGIHSIQHNLLSVFSLKFQSDCLDIFQQTEYSSQKVQKMVKFILLLDVVQKGETWPLLDLVAPTLKKSFPLIETHVSYRRLLILLCLVYMLLSLSFFCG